MSKTKLIMELGMGTDLHGGDSTKAARRAVEDAVRHGSLLYLGEVAKEGVRPKMYVDVAIAVPNPETVDNEAVLAALPFGEKTISVTAGGMAADTGGADKIIIANAAVMVTVEV